MLRSAAATPAPRGVVSLHFNRRLCDGIVDRLVVLGLDVEYLAPQPCQLVRVEGVVELGGDVRRAHCRVVWQETGACARVRHQRLVSGHVGDSSS